MEADMKMKLYQLLVNRHSGISHRYHKVHDNSGTVMKALSWLNLFLWFVSSVSGAAGEGKAV